MDGSDGGSNAPPPFLTKTYEMVDDTATDTTVSWSAAGKSFVVWDQLEFCRLLLPKYFKHNNFSSFVRQLNTYGFRKIDPNQWEFANDGFIRGQKHLLKNIHRRKPIHSHSLQQQQASSSSLSEEERQELEETISKLKHAKNTLLVELQSHTQDRQTLETQIESLNNRLRKVEFLHHQLIIYLRHTLQNPDFLSDIAQKSEYQERKRRLPNSGIMQIEEHPDRDFSLILDFERFEKMESSLDNLEKLFQRVGKSSGEIFDCDSLKSSTVVLTELNPSSSGGTDLSHRSPSPDCVEIDVNSAPAPQEDMCREDRGKGMALTKPAITGVNDVFWEQFLTETPGSTGNQEAQSVNEPTGDGSMVHSEIGPGGAGRTAQLEIRPADSRRIVQSAMGPAEVGERAQPAREKKGELWWARKNVEHITEQMSHLIQSERTR